MSMIYYWTDKDATRRVLPTPSSFSWQYSDVDKDSGRNDYGKMMRNKLASKNKISMTWNADKEPEADAELINILMNLPPFFYCMFPDATNTMRTMECYRGDIKANVYRYDPANGNIWKDKSCNFIER